ASADAVYVIDGGLYKIAMSLTLDWYNLPSRLEPLQEASKLRRDAEPLTPVVLRVVALSCAAPPSELSLTVLHEALGTLAAIAVEDEEAVLYTKPLLRHPLPAIRVAVAEFLGRQRQTGKVALPDLLRRLKPDVESDEVALLQAVRAVGRVADTNDKKARDALLALRFHKKSSAVRDAVREELERFKME